MKTSVILVSSNFASFIEQSLTSVLTQETAPTEVILVDDGSTDGTLEKARAFADREPRIKIFSLNRQGHLAALNKGVSEASGDILFLLDGDDTYEPIHIASCVQVFQDTPQVDLVCTGYRVFGLSEKTVLRHRASGLLGSSAIAAMVARYWPVGPTSCLSLRATLAKKIFPYPAHWLVHGIQTGEAGVVLGASILGAREYFVSSPLVNYRSHGANFDLGRRPSAENSYRSVRLSHEIIEHFRAQVNLPANFALQALAEFKTWPSPGKPELDCYTRIIWQSSHPLLKRFELVLRAWRHYRNTL